jgi:hypothetical protein
MRIAQISFSLNGAFWPTQGPQLYEELAGEVHQGGGQAINRRELAIEIPRNDGIVHRTTPRRYSASVGARGGLGPSVRSAGA